MGSCVIFTKESDTNQLGLVAFLKLSKEL